MTNWRELLREADPLRDDVRAPMPGADAIRRAVVATAQAQTTNQERWLGRAFALAATVILIVSIGSITGHRLAVGERREPPAAAAPSHPGAVRQLQFSTPGGTRIIWIFNQDLNLNETRP